MADFENENPESTHDFINVDKPEAEVAPVDFEPEHEPEVSSTSEIMEPTRTESDEHLQKEEKEETPEVPEEKSDVSDEKPTAPEADSTTSSSRELTSFPARWMKEHNVDNRVIDLIYWKNMKKTGIVFATTLAVLMSLHCYSLLSVMTFFSMAVLTVALLYRVGMTVMGAIQKSGSENPFKKYLEKDIDISKDKVTDVVECAVCKINCGTKKLRKLFLVEDIVDSIKFGVVLWVLSYIGAWFNMLTLVILGVIVMFSFPKVYEEHQDKIDEVLKTVHTQVKNIIEQAKSKLPEKLRPKEKAT